MARRLFSVILMLSCLSLSCKEEIVVSSEDTLVEARIMPRVTFTDPPMNSVGPYLSWGEYTFAGYPLLVRFNKLMESVSVRRAIRITSSLRTFTVDTNAVYGESKYNAQYTFYPQRPYYYGIAPPQIGEVFTVRMASPAVDVNGNLLLPGLLGTFVPEPTLRVQTTTPVQGGILGAGENTIVLAFNGTLDSTIFNSISLDPPYQERWEIRMYDSTVVSIRLSAPIPGIAHRVRVAAGARDKSGNVLPEPFNLDFRTQGMELVDGGRDEGTIPLFQPHRLRFSRLLDTATVRAAIHITLPVAGGVGVFFYFYPLTTFEFQPLTDFAPQTRYTVVIDTSLRSADGAHLSEPATFSFTTDAFRMTGSTPSDGETGVSTGTGALISFSGRLDTSTTRRSFSSSPAADWVYYTGYGPSVMSFYPVDTLHSFTTYAVTIDTSLRSLGGYHLAAPFTITYTTGGF